MGIAIKYSLIIPTRNSLFYLKDAINSVISQNYKNYELIISDNFSDDGTSEYVQSLQHPNIKLYRTASFLSMSDNWEFALSKASGDWIMFLGSDDGVTPYFFDLAEKLTEIADTKNIKAINSIRSYFFWKGCEKIYENQCINFMAINTYSIKYTKYELLNALIGVKNYIDLPHMYTESLIHKDCVEKIKSIQHGQFYKGTVTDAYGAACLNSLFESYIESKISFGWVGSSVKSCGLRGNARNPQDSQELKTTFEKKNYAWDRRAGDCDGTCFSRFIHNFRVFLWEALLQFDDAKSHYPQGFFTSKKFIILFFAKLLSEIEKNKKEYANYLDILKEMCVYNNVSFTHISLVKKYIIPIVTIFFNIHDKLKNVKTKFYSSTKKIHISEQWIENKEITLLGASARIEYIFREKEMIKSLFFIK